MPPRRVVKSKVDACDGNDAVSSKKPKAPPKKRGGRKMPPPLPPGEVLTDLAKGRWVLGTSVGKGGFGEIYLAAPEGSSASLAVAKHVVKIEPHENGPLFTELSFYHRVGKPQCIDDWVKKKGLRFLGVPRYIGSGSHVHDSMQYRFMVMERYGNDLQKTFEEGGRKFSVKTICYLALRLLEALEYLHEHEYTHADVKASNILVGHESKHEICLVDYGLAYRYSPEGVHKGYKEDPRRRHDGTIEFTSIDAHKGANPSRRGDLEILGYCMLQWACGRLPWEDDLADKDRVAQLKMKYREDVDGLMTACFGSSPPTPSCLKDYLQYVCKLGYEERPDYEMLKGLFHRALKSGGMSDDHSSLDWLTHGKKRKSPEVVTSPFSKKMKRFPLDEEVDAGDDVSQIKPTKAGGVRKQAATKKAISKKRKSAEDTVVPPVKKVKRDEQSSSHDEQEASSHDEQEGSSHEPQKSTKLAKKPSPPASKLSSVVDNKEELSSEEAGSKDSKKEPTKETKRVRAVNKKSKAKQPDTSGKIPEVTYPTCLGYGNGSDPDDGSQHSSVESKKTGEEEIVPPRKSRRLNPTT